MREQDIDPELGPEDSPGPPGTAPAGAARFPVGAARSWATLAVIALGGAAGSLARYGLSVAFPHPPGSFDWATLGINVSGCALIGVLMVAITEVRRTHHLARPFLVVGVLGGFTTFSTYIVDIQRSLDAGATASALAYLAGTLAAALAAVAAGMTAMRWLAGTGLLARWTPAPPAGPPAPPASAEGGK